MTADQKKKPAAGFWITVALFVALVSYPLSIGPAQWLIWKLEVPWIGKAGHFLYYPIASACSRSETLGRIVHWYIGLWWDWNDAPGVKLPPGVRFLSSWSSLPWD